jgi:hypothetical protein
MNDQMPAWSAWKAPSPSPYFDARVWQKLEASRTARNPASSWLERLALSGALAGATALMVISLNLNPPARTAFAAVPGASLTRAYADALHRR